MKRFTGTGVAIVTPFKNDYSIDFKSLNKLVEFLVSNNADYLVALGTTGESVTQSKDEKCAVVDCVLEANEKRVPVIVGVGGNNTRQVVNTIKELRSEEIQGILSVAPYYNKPEQKGLYLHFKTIAESSPVPVIIYNVPGRASVNISAETTLRLAHDIPNISGIKEASGNLEQVSKIIKDKPEEFDVISGDDTLTLPIISLGGSGVISVLANAFPDEWSEMVSNALKGNLKAARKIHYKFVNLIDELFVEGNPAGIKAVLNILGLIENSLRLPLTTVSRSTYTRIGKIIEEF